MPLRENSVDFPPAGSIQIAKHLSPLQHLAMTNHGLKVFLGDEVITRAIDFAVPAFACRVTDGDLNRWEVAHESTVKCGFAGSRRS